MNIEHLPVLAERLVERFSSAADIPSTAIMFELMNMFQGASREELVELASFVYEFAEEVE